MNAGNVPWQPHSSCGILSDEVLENKGILGRKKKRDRIDSWKCREPRCNSLYVFFLLSFKSLTNVVASVICLRKTMHYLFSPAPLYICGVVATSCLQSQHAGQLCCRWRKGVSYGCPSSGISTTAVLPELLPCFYSPGISIYSCSSH